MHSSSASLTDALPLRILHLGKYYPPAPGGIESHVQTLASGQAKLGNDVSVVCVNHAGPDGGDIFSGSLKKTKTKCDQVGEVRVERVGRWFGFGRLDICPTILKTVREECQKADIVHLHAPNPLMLAAWWLSGSRKVPTVITHHSDVVKQKFLQVLVRPLEKAVYKKAEVIFTTNPNYLEGSTQLASFSNKVVSLPMGIDLSYYLNPTSQILEDAQGIKETLGCPLWLMVGRLTYYKGFHVALEALTKVQGKLVIVGNGGLEAELRSQADRLGIQDRIVWMSSVSRDRLISLYHASTALWFPSIARSEGFGLVQVEAMASGCPVINSSIPASGVSWVSKDGESGLTVPVGDPESLAQAAIKMTSDNLRKKLAVGAKNRAQSLFDAKRMCLDSISYYKKFSI